jgi:hypothetical protein
MEWLVSFFPIGLILFACVGLHFFMMRGMHGGHGAGHEGHSGLGGEDSPDRLAQLESQVKRLRQELDASQGDGQSARNGHRREPVAAVHHQDDTAANDPRRGYN